MRRPPLETPVFDGLPFGINLSSQARAGFAALLAHAAVITLAIDGSEQPTPPARASADTVHIELSRIPTPEHASSESMHSPLGSLPSAPALPAAPLVLPAPGFAVDSTHTGPGLAALRSLTIREPMGTVGESQRASAPVASRDVDQLPTLRGDLKPRYPDELRAALLTGQVIVEYVVNADGRVGAGSIRIVRSSHPAFSRAVIQALANARFNPARVGRMPVAVLVQQTIRFEAGLR
jgi:TonB family protein